MVLKYLAEGTDPRPIAGLFLMSVPDFGKQNWELEYAVPDDFASHLPPIQHLFLYHSRSDEEVPFASLRRYQEHLPQATVRVLDGKQHSFTEGLPCLLKTLSGRRLDITKEQWMSLLRDKETITEQDLCILKALYRCEGCKATAPQLAEALGMSH